MNLGEGSVVIYHPNGWACSREAELDVEFDMMPDKSAKRTTVITCKGLFNIGGDFNNGYIEGVFKYDNGIKIAFKASVQGKGRLILIGETNNDFETILNKYHNGRSNSRKINRC